MSTSVIERMESDLRDALKRLQDARRVVEKAENRVKELRLAIRTVRSYLGGEVGGKNAVPMVAGEKGAGTQSTDHPRKLSVRMAAVGVLEAAPGTPITARAIAEKLLSEGFPYDAQGYSGERLLSRFRETISAVLGQHIKANQRPLVLKTDPAEYMIVPTDVDGGRAPTTGEENHTE